MEHVPSMLDSILKCGKGRIASGVENICLAVVSTSAPPRHYVSLSLDLYIAKKGEYLGETPVSIVLKLSI